MRLELPLPSGSVLVAEIDDTDESAGRELLQRLAPSATSLHDGRFLEVDLDWTAVRLRARGHEVYVEEPDYRRNVADFAPTFVLTCRVFAAQQQMLQALRVKGLPVKAQQFVRVSNDALQSVSVVGVRRPESESLFSGWQIVSTASDEAHGQYTVRELSGNRLAWCVPLPLPAHWAFRFVGRSLVDAVSPDGKTHALNLSIDL